MHCSLVGSSGHWRCVFCKATNSSGGEYRAADGVDLRNWPELVTSVVDYVDAGTVQDLCPTFNYVAGSVITTGSGDSLL